MGLKQPRSTSYGSKSGMAFSNTAGDWTCKSTWTLGRLKEFFLPGQRLLDRRLHRLDSTPHGIAVNRACPTGTRRAPLAQEIMHDVERRHDGNTVDTCDLAAVANVAHLAVEIGDCLGEFGSLVFSACHLVLASENWHIQCQRVPAGHSLGVHSAGIRARSASRRAVACWTRSASSRLRCCACASSLRSDSLAARKARVWASNVASRCSNDASSGSMRSGQVVSDY